MFRVGLEGWPRWSAHPFVVLSAGGHVYPAFAPNTQVFAPSSSEMAAGFFFFLVFFGPEFAPTGHAHSYF